MRDDDGDGLLDDLIIVGVKLLDVVSDCLNTGQKEEIDLFVRQFLEQITASSTVLILAVENGLVTLVIRLLQPFLDNGRDFNGLNLPTFLLIIVSYACQQKSEP